MLNADGSWLHTNVWDRGAPAVMVVLLVAVLIALILAILVILGVAPTLCEVLVGVLHKKPRGERYTCPECGSARRFEGEMPARFCHKCGHKF